jgi:hypothetical protein
MMKKRHGTRTMVLLGLVAILVLVCALNLGCQRRDRRPVPPAPELVAPANGSTNITLRPTFSWVGGTPTEFYQLYISEQTDPVLYVLNGQPIVITEEAYTLTVDLQPNTTYYWLVMACLEYPTGHIASTHSEVKSFTTGAL